MDTNAFLYPSWVVQKTGKYAGRIGLVIARYGPAHRKVQFGPSGPVQVLSVRSLREATPEEEAEKTGEPVRHIISKRKEKAA